ncbi:hypothetical protein ACYBSK_33435 [Streptomyces sp. BYX5S]
MTLPAPVARLLGAAAGRRALQLALLFGGLLVLGIVCGGRAQADGLSAPEASGAGSLGAGHVTVREHVADSARKLRAATTPDAATVSTDAAPAASEASAATAAREPVASRTGAPQADPERVPARSAEPAPKRATVQHTSTTRTSTTRTSAPQASVLKRTGLSDAEIDEPAALTAATAPASVRTRLAESLRHLTEPVGVAVRQVTGSVEELASCVVGLAEEVPQRLTEGDLADLVGLGEPAATRPGPAATTPQHPQAAAAHADRPAVHDRSAHAATSGPRAHGAAQFGAVQGPATAAAHDVARSGSAPYMPERPDGVPSVGASAGDGGSTRHGDLHAAAFGDRAPVLLASGATASAGTSPVVDRLRDIPEFPG